MEEELQSRNVKIINFYDVVLDYILIDSFEVSHIEHKIEDIKNFASIFELF